jgi:hypothetical protein
VFKRTILVGRDVIGSIAFDFVLRIVSRSAMGVTLVVEVSGMDGDDGPRYPTGLGIPTYMIANLESHSHLYDFSSPSIDGWAARAEARISPA